MTDAMRQNFEAYLHQYIKDGRITLIGPFYDGPVPTNEPVIFVDGGTKYRKDRLGFALGDGDSFAGGLDLQLEARKDFSDLSFALNHLPSEYRCIELNGFLGGRRDHEWLNLGEAHRFLKTRTQPTEIYFDSQVRAFSMGDWEFSFHGLFTVLCFEDTLVHLTGECEYTIDPSEILKALSSHGLSNQGSGKIQLATNGPVFVLFN